MKYKGASKKRSRAQRRIAIVNELSQLSRDGWARATTDDYKPLEEELAAMDEEEAAQKLARGEHYDDVLDAMPERKR